MDTGKQQPDKKQLLQQQQLLLQKQVQQHQLLKQHQQSQHQQQQQLKQQKLLQTQSQSQQPQQLLHTQSQTQQQLIAQQQILCRKQAMQQENLNKQLMLQDNQKKQEQQQQLHLQQPRQQQDQHMQLQSLNQKYIQSNLQQPQFIQQHQILQQPEPQIVQPSLQQSPQLVQQSQNLNQSQILQKSHLIQPQIIQQPYHVQQSPIIHQPQIVQKSQLIQQSPLVQQSSHIKQPQIIQQSHNVQQKNQYNNASSQQQIKKQPPHTHQMLQQQLQQLMSTNNKNPPRIVVLNNQPQQQQQQFMQQPPQRVQAGNTTGQQQIMAPQVQCVVVTGAGQQQPQQVPRMIVTGPGQQMQHIQQVVIPSSSQQVQNIRNPTATSQQQPQQKQRVIVSAANQQPQQPQLVVVNSNSSGQQKQQFIQQPQVQPVGQRIVIGQLKTSQQTQQIQSSSQRGVVVNQLQQPTGQRPITVKQQQQRVVIANQQQVLKFPQQQSPQPIMFQQHLTQLSQPKQQQPQDVQHKVTQQSPQNVVANQQQKTNVKLSDQSLVQQMYVKQSHQQLQQFHIQPTQKKAQQNLPNPKRLKQQQRQQKPEQQPKKFEQPLRSAVIVGQLQRPTRSEPEQLKQKFQVQQEQRKKLDDHLKLQQRKYQQQKHTQENKLKHHEQQLREKVLLQQHLKQIKQQQIKQDLLTMQGLSENRTSFVIGVDQNENQQDAEVSTKNCEKTRDHLQILAKDVSVNQQAFLKCQNYDNVTTDEDNVISSSSDDDDEDNEIVKKERNLYYEAERLVEERYKKLSIVLGPKYQVYYDVILRNWLLGGLSRDEYDREMRKVFYVSWALRSIPKYDGKNNNGSLVLTTDANTVLTVTDPTEIYTSSTSDSLITLTSETTTEADQIKAALSTSMSKEKNASIFSLKKPMTNVTPISLMNNVIEESMDADMKIKEATAVLRERLPLHNELITSLVAWLPHYLLRLERRSGRNLSVTDTGRPLRLYCYRDTPPVRGHTEYWYPEVPGSLARWYWPNRLPFSTFGTNIKLELSVGEQEQMDVEGAKFGPPSHASVSSVLQYAEQKSVQYNHRIEAKQPIQYKKSYPIKFHEHETKWAQWQRLKSQNGLIPLILLQDKYEKLLREYKAYSRKYANYGCLLKNRLVYLQKHILLQLRQDLAQFDVRLLDARARIYKQFNRSWQELPENKARQQLLIKSSTVTTISDETIKDDEQKKQGQLLEDIQTTGNQIKTYSTRSSVKLLHFQKKFWKSYKLLLAVKKKYLEVQRNANYIRELRYKNCPCGVLDRHSCFYQKQMYRLRKQLIVCKEKVLNPSVNLKVEKKENAKKRKTVINKNKLKGKKRKPNKVKNIVEDNEKLKVDKEDPLLAGKNINSIVSDNDLTAATVNTINNTPNSTTIINNLTTCSSSINTQNLTIYSPGIPGSKTKCTSSEKDITNHDVGVSCMPSPEKNLSTRSNILSDCAPKSLLLRKGQNKNVNVADAATRAAEAALAAYRKSRIQRSQEIERRVSKLKPSTQVRKNQLMNGYMKLQDCLKELCHKHDVVQESTIKNQDDLGDFGQKRDIEERQQNKHYLYVGGSSYSSDDISESSIRPLSPLLHDLRHDQLLPIPLNRRWSQATDQTHSLEPSPFIIHQNFEPSVHKLEIEREQNHEQYRSYINSDHDKEISKFKHKKSFQNVILNAGASSLLTSLPGHNVCEISDSADRQSNKLPINKIKKLNKQLPNRDYAESHEQQLQFNENEQQQYNNHNQLYQKQHRLPNTTNAAVELQPTQQEQRKIIGKSSGIEKLNSPKKIKVNKEPEQTNIINRKNQDSLKNKSRTKHQSKRASGRKKQSEQKDKSILTEKPRPLPELEIAEENQSFKWKAPLTQWNKRPLDNNINMRYPIEKQTNTLNQEINDKMKGESEFLIDSSRDRRIEFPNSNQHQNNEEERLFSDRQQQNFSETDWKVRKLISEYQELIADLPQGQMFDKLSRLIQLLRSSESYEEMYTKSKSCMIKLLEQQLLAIQFDKIQPSPNIQKPLVSSTFVADVQEEIILEQLRQTLTQFKLSQENFHQVPMIANVNELQTNVTADDPCIKIGTDVDDLQQWYDLWPAYEDKQNGDDDIFMDEEQRLRVTQQLIDRYHSSKCDSEKKSVPSLQQQNQYLGLNKQDRIEHEKIEGHRFPKQNSVQLKSSNEFKKHRQQRPKQQQSHQQTQTINGLEQIKQLEHHNKLLPEQKKKIHTKKQQEQHKRQELHTPLLDQRQYYKQKNDNCGNMQSNCLVKWKLRRFVKSPTQYYKDVRPLREQLFRKIILKRVLLQRKLEQEEQQPTSTYVNSKMTPKLVTTDNISEVRPGSWKTYRGSTLWWTEVGFNWKISTLVIDDSVKCCLYAINQFNRLRLTNNFPLHIMTQPISNTRQNTIPQNGTIQAVVISRKKVRDKLTIAEKNFVQKLIHPKAFCFWTTNERRCLSVLCYNIKNLTEEVKLHWDAMTKIQEERTGLLMKYTEKMQQKEQNKQQSHTSRTVDQELELCVKSAFITGDIHTSGTMIIETENHMIVHEKWHELDAIRLTHQQLWKKKLMLLHEMKYTKYLVNRHLYHQFEVRYLLCNKYDKLVSTAMVLLPSKPLTPAEREKMKSMIQQLHAFTLQQKKASSQKITEKEVLPKKPIKQNHPSQKIPQQNKKKSCNPIKKKQLLSKLTKPKSVVQQRSIRPLSDETRKMSDKKTQSKNKPKSRLKQQNQLKKNQKKVIPIPQIEATLPNLFSLQNQLSRIDFLRLKREWLEQQPENFENISMYPKLTKLQIQNITCAFRNSLYLLYQQWICLETKLCALNVHAPDKQSESLLSRSSTIFSHQPLMNSVNLPSQSSSIMSIILKPHQPQLADDLINPKVAVPNINEQGQCESEILEIQERTKQQMGIIFDKLKPLVSLWYLTNKLPLSWLEQQFVDLNQAIEEDLFGIFLNNSSGMSGLTTDSLKVTVNRLWQQFTRAQEYFICLRQRVQIQVNEYLKAVYREYLMTEQPSTYSMFLKMLTPMSDNKSGVMILNLNKSSSPKQAFSVSSLTTTSPKILSSIQHSSTHFIKLQLQNILEGTQNSLIYSMLLTLNQPYMSKELASVLLTPYQQLTSNRKFPTPSMILTSEPSPSKRKLLMLLKRRQILTPKLMNSLVLETRNPIFNTYKQLQGQINDIQQSPEKRRLNSGNKNNYDIKRPKPITSKESILSHKPINCEQLKNLRSVHHPQIKNPPYIYNNENNVIEILDSDDEVSEIVYLNDYTKSLNYGDLRSKSTSRIIMDKQLSQPSISRESTLKSLRIIQAQSPGTSTSKDLRNEVVNNYEIVSTTKYVDIDKMKKNNIHNDGVKKTNNQQVYEKMNDSQDNDNKIYNLHGEKIPPKSVGCNSSSTKAVGSCNQSTIAISDNEPIIDLLDCDESVGLLTTINQRKLITTEETMDSILSEVAPSRQTFTECRLNTNEVKNTNLMTNHWRQMDDTICKIPNFTRNRHLVRTIINDTVGLPIPSFRDHGFINGTIEEVVHNRFMATILSLETISSVQSFMPSQESQTSFKNTTTNPSYSMPINDNNTDGLNINNKKVSVSTNTALPFSIIMDRIKEFEFSKNTCLQDDSARTSASTLKAMAHKTKNHKSKFRTDTFTLPQTTRPSRPTLMKITPLVEKPTVDESPIKKSVSSSFPTNSITDGEQLLLTTKRSASVAFKTSPSTITTSLLPSPVEQQKRSKSAVTTATTDEIRGHQSSIRPIKRSASVAFTSILPPSPLHSAIPTETSFSSLSPTMIQPPKRFESVATTPSTLTSTESSIKSISRSGAIKRSKSSAASSSTIKTMTSPSSATKPPKRSKSAATTTTTSIQDIALANENLKHQKLGKRSASDITTRVFSSTVPTFGSSKRYKSSVTMMSPPLTQYLNKITTDSTKPTMTPITSSVDVNHESETFESNKINNDSPRAVTIMNRTGDDNDPSNTNITATKEEICSVNVNRTTCLAVPTSMDVTAEACKLVVTACEDLVRAMVKERILKAGRGAGTLELRRRDAMYAAMVADENIRQTPEYCRTSKIATPTVYPTTEVDQCNESKKLLENQLQRRVHGTTTDELENEKRILVIPKHFNSEQCSIIVDDKSELSKVIMVETVVETKITTTITTANDKQCSTPSIVSLIKIQPSPSEQEVVETSARTSGILVRKTARKLMLPRSRIAAIDNRDVVNHQQPKTIIIPSNSKKPMTSVTTPLPKKQSETEKSSFLITQTTKKPTPIGNTTEEINKTLTVAKITANSAGTIRPYCCSTYIEPGRPLLRSSFQKRHPYGTTTATSIMAAEKSSIENNAYHEYFNYFDDKLDVIGQINKDIGDDEWKHGKDSNHFPPISRLNWFTQDNNPASTSMVGTKSNFDGVVQSKTPIKILPSPVEPKDDNKEEKMSPKRQLQVKLEVIHQQQQRKQLDQELNKHVQKHQNLLPDSPEVLHQKFIKLQFEQTKELPVVPLVGRSLNINRRQGLVSW